MDYNYLDLETTATKDRYRDHAGLEPWRVRHGTAEIMSCDVLGPGLKEQIVNNNSETFKRQLRDRLASLKGQVVWAHNAVFDIAWLIATLQPERCGPIPKEITDIDWRCSQLFFKWLTNGQVAESSRFSLSLANLCKTFLQDDPDTAEFVAFKEVEFVAGAEMKDYWLKRGGWDCEMTFKLVDRYISRLPAQQRIGFLTECSDLVPVANAWINGIRIIPENLDIAEEFYATRKSRIAKHLNVSPAMFTSPKQLANYLFNDLGLNPVSKTPSGNPGTSKDDLKWMRFALLEAGNKDKAEIISLILEAKESSTMLSKYVKTTHEALEHTTDGFIYGAPKLFGTYTGRMTYSNSTLRKWKTGLALHQVPRKAQYVRAMMAPPEGYKVYEADASGQESRLMAIRSGDPMMLEVFANEMNFHAMTGSRIITMDYDDFMEEYMKEDGSGYHTEQRQMGKLANLSCNYRISGEALARQAYTKYDTYIDKSTGRHLVSTFNRAYPGVEQYWKDVINESMQRGYTEEFGGRRFKLSEWSSNRWATESSALMFPIQGAGASMKEIAIKELFSKEPNFHFALDLHDASFGFIRDDIAEDVRKNLDDILNTIDYEKYWGFKTPIKLPYESKMGETFKDVK